MGHRTEPTDSPLPPNEPRILDQERQRALTERFLLPALPALEALFLHIRTILDPKLSQAQPSKLGKPYPLGQCLEISQAVIGSVPQLNPAILTGAAVEGYSALAGFLQHGGRSQQIWGDLRGEYFQNAFLLGTLYLDVSNDTVVPTKPKVEILPFEAADLRPVKDFEHFARIAGRYWKAEVYPNHILPSLAPYFPLIVQTAAGAITLEGGSNYMVALTMANQFRPSEAVLDAPPMYSALFESLADCFVGIPLEVAHTSLRGREMALQYCRQFRAERRYFGDIRHGKIIKYFQLVTDVLIARYFATPI
jgi:hypothetical protein